VLVLVRRGARPRLALDQARLTFEKMLTYANHVGLYAEQISRAGQQQGNSPQALTHLR
jgi:GH15 family glucan-1,4-alpha-glucosidase